VIQKKFRLISKKVRSLSKREQLTSVLALCLVLAAVVPLLANRHPSTQSQNIENKVLGASGPVYALSEKQRWSGEIDRIGAQAAYEEFKSAYQDKSFGTQHTVAHIFGQLLYEKMGLQGLTICDATFAFGCFHSFFSRAFSEKGLGIVLQANEACIEKYSAGGTGCLHGIGHGIIDYLGHDKLVESLAVCTKTTQVNPLFGCTSGVFMEYNVPVIIDSERSYTKFRDLNSANPYEPCNTIVPGQFRESCYYEMGQWWDKVYFGDYQKIGQLCAGIDNSTWQRSCFLGVGNVAAPSSQYEVGATISKCQQMPTEEGRLICRTGASWSFMGYPPKKSLSASICAGLDQESSKKCLQGSDLFSQGITNNQ
jgi:hypothetical protein